MKSVTVIGAGFGGLTAACFLAKNGFKVQVIEKNPTAGGRAMHLNRNGFKFDLGPSWYMMPEVFDEIFNELGKDRKNYFKLKKLDPSYRVFFADNEVIDVNTVDGSIFKYFDSKEPGASQKLKIYLEKNKKRYQLILSNFIRKNFKSLFDLIRPKLIKNIFNVGILGSWQNEVNMLFKNDKLRKLLTWHSAFVAGSPKYTPPAYSLMTHVDYNLGVFYPDNGFQSLVDALLTIAKEYGATFNFNEEVTKIRPENKKVQIQTTNNTYYTDYVVANADYQFVETKLLSKEFRTYDDSYWKNRTLGPATFCVYLGINKKLKNLLHHNYYFSNGWEQHFDSLYKSNLWPTDPSIYISCPSKTDINVAPHGFENIMLLIPVAPGLADTDEIRETLAQKAINQLEKISGESLEKNIIYKKIISQRDHITMYNAFQGNALGLAHTLSQTGPFRPVMQSKKLPELFFAGHYTQPGTSTVMSTLSGQLAAQELINYDKSKNS